MGPLTVMEAHRYEMEAKETGTIQPHGLSTQGLLGSFSGLFTAIPLSPKYFPGFFSSSD